MFVVVDRRNFLCARRCSRYGARRWFIARLAVRTEGAARTSAVAVVSIRIV
jgi:hypothetical protein